MLFHKLLEGKFCILVDRNVFKFLNIVLCFSKIENCYFTINQLVNSGMSQEDAWNANSIKLTKATEVILNTIFFFKLIKNYYFTKK